MESKSILLTAVLALLLTWDASAQPNKIFEAIRHNNFSSLKQLLEQKVNLDIYDEDSETVLMNAALYASVECMALLLEKGAPANATNPTGQTALMWSVGDVRKAKLLLDHGANPNAKASSGNTPFLVACPGADRLEILQLLKKYGADPKASNSKDENAMYRMALFGDSASARFLLNSGVSINQQSKSKKTPLFAAVLNNNKPMIFWLLANGADANLPDNAGAPVLSYAVDLNDADIVKAVLQKTADSVINGRDIDGMTPLMWALYDEHDNVQVIQALLDRGADVHIKDNKGRTALYWGMKKGNNARVALIKKQEALTGTR
jgi:ankyrin repeat protein